MKTKFYVNSEVFSNGKIEDCYKYYYNNFQNLGFILDKDNEDVYKIYDTEIHLNEGDRINLFGHKIVEWKCVNINDNVIEYLLKEE